MRGEQGEARSQKRCDFGGTKAMKYPTSPEQLAIELGHGAGTRAGSRVRKFLRLRYPEHVKYEPWQIDEAMADAVRAHFEIRAHYDRRAGRRPRILDRDR